MQMVAPMSVERKEQGATRQNILQLLRRNGQMTALELSQELNIGAVGIRQHLALLERDGLVAVSGVRRNIGRPSHLYMLTPEAEQHFPKQYDRFALDVLNFICADGGSDVVDQVFEARRKALVQAYAPRLHGKSRGEKVAELAKILAEQGYMCEYEQLNDGSYMLTEHNCPIDCIARRYSQSCHQELKLYEELLGVPIERETTIVSGGHCCRYRIPA